MPRKLISLQQQSAIEAAAQKSKALLEPVKTSKSPKGLIAELNSISESVTAYFKDSPAILITSVDQLHDYITKAIESRYVGIDTETTGLDRIKDSVVGASLYYPGGVECYIPMKHLHPLFDNPYIGQLSYQEVGTELQRFVDSKTRMIFANADFDLSMIYKDLKVDMCDICYYDVILAWRCLKEDEKDNALKVLYNKYVMRGKGDPMKFRDFFTPQLFPYCKPEVAKLYAANDAKITYELFKWQLPYVTKDNRKCQKSHLESIASLIWDVEFPLIKVCQQMHRTGIYLDKSISSVLLERYKSQERHELEVLAGMVDELLSNSSTLSTFDKKPFRYGSEFNAKSPVHVKYLLYTVMNLPKGKNGESTDKEVLGELNLPVTRQILKVRSLGVLISTFVEKLPKATTVDSRIHAHFNQIGADTGRMSSADPNMQNIPSHATDIRHMFRATPGYVMLSSDYSQQEPKLTAFVSQDAKMIDAFKNNRDIYATIASLAFGLPYEKCLEFHPETKEYQPDGKARRGEAKTIVLGITYGRSVVTIADQLFGTNDKMTQEEKIEAAQKIYDSVLNAFPNLRKLMVSAQKMARTHGYVETILGRRRHLPNMQLPPFEFTPLSGYVNPDIDPLDPSTLQNKSIIPDRVLKALTDELSSYRHYGQVAKRTRELYEQDHIRVTNNRSKIADATRQCVNSIIQGSAADQTKLALLRLESNERWKAIGGRLLVPVHDELIAEVPIEHWKEGGEILSKMMVDAADFLPFSSKCDVTTTLRWYGLEYPCPYTKPSTLDTVEPDEVKWLQYCLCELEYVLPVFKDENGDKPRGDAALGVNGLVSPEYDAAIASYRSKYNLTTDAQFLDHIEHKVFQGV